MRRQHYNLNIPHLKCVFYSQLSENVQSTEELDMEDFIKKFPVVSKAIKNDQQKQAIQKYFKDKVRCSQFLSQMI